MKNSLKFAIVALMVISCGVKYPKMLSFTPASVMIDYSDSDLHQATSMAQQYCSSIGKDAQYVRTEESGWVSKERHGFFNCVEKHNNNNNNGNSSQAMPIINNFK
jgi:hypothetical protein